MEKAVGLRKVIIFTEALVAFCFLEVSLGLTDPGAILALGTSLGGLLGAAIYGNVKVHQANGNKP